MGPYSWTVHVQSACRINGSCCRNFYLWQCWSLHGKEVPMEELYDIHQNLKTRVGSWVMARKDFSDLKVNDSINNFDA